MAVCISAEEAIRHIREAPGTFAFLVGAGASAEAEVKRIKLAAEICEELKQKKLAERSSAPDQALIEEVETELSWYDHSRRYVNCVQVCLPNVDKRLRYFREISTGARPGFCHHGIATLMTEGICQPTCLTTNFDKLLETAFSVQGRVECQVIRSEEEARFWQRRTGRYFVVKLHGDYDTYNILNTPRETTEISRGLKAVSLQVADRAGIVAIGSAGFEASVLDLFQRNLGRDVFADGAGLSAGLLWGVFMSEEDPGPLSSAELHKRIEKRLSDNTVSVEMQRFIKDGNRFNRLFCFFPIWSSSGKFILDLIRGSLDASAVARAELYLDHSTRLQNKFGKKGKGLGETAIQEHVRSLNRSKQKQASPEAVRRAPPPPLPEAFLEATPCAAGPRIELLYGDITNPVFMNQDRLHPLRRAVVSPEDTYLSAGGGVALQLLQKAGEYSLLNELAKFEKIDQGDVAVTSGGQLPVHYIFHAAAIEIGERDQRVVYLAEESNISVTTSRVLNTADALGVKALLIPLLGTGVAGVPHEASLEAIVGAIARHRKDSAIELVLIFVYKHTELETQPARKCLEKVLGDAYTVKRPG